ncbi:hypothetical protein [Fodinicola feengrottensis]|uniref:hypothetical protein n=1 Tax=Fodinicola feengrottensis TaxID=435914 RepID=UPI0013D50F83|nr:hypothetical protein [Fodinicola feengrottensis]
MIALRRGDQDRFADLAGRLEDFANRHPGSPEIARTVGYVAISGPLERGDLDLADQLVGNFLAAPPDDWPLSPDRLWVVLAAARTQRARLATQPRNRQVVAEVAARLQALRSLLAGAFGISVLPALPAAQLVTFQALAGKGSLKEWDAAAAAWRDLGHRYELASALTAGAAVALAVSSRSSARLRLREAHDRRRSAGRAAAVTDR